MNRKKILFIVVGVIAIYFIAVLIILGHKTSDSGMSIASLGFSEKNLNADADNTSFIDENLQIDTFSVNGNTVKVYCTKDDGKVLARYGDQDTIQTNGWNDIERHYAEHHEFPTGGWIRLGGGVLDLKVNWGHAGKGHIVSMAGISTYIVGDEDDLEAALNRKLELFSKKEVDFIYVPCTRKLEH